MASLIIRNRNKAIEFTPGSSLLDILVLSDIFIERPCNGKGTCGKCRIRHISGEIDEPSETELKHLSENDIKTGVRLSCLVFPNENLEIEVFEGESNHRILTEGVMPEFEFDPSVKRLSVNLIKPTLDNQRTYEDVLREKSSGYDVDMDVLLSSDLTFGEKELIAYDSRIIDILSSDSENGTYGAAIDIGTTTIALSLVDLSDGRILASESMINGQKKFGLDVLTRITYAIENPAIAQLDLQSEIVACINSMIDSACRKAGVDSKRIYEITVAANCTMMHMLLGIDSRSIGKSPYTPVFISAKKLKASDIGIKAGSSTLLYCLPSVSAYIGADIVAGAYVCGLKEAKDNVLFIDIGTNGEIVLSKAGTLSSCSCAAGPALEGMNISCGMRAADGAIEEISISEDGIQVDTIGDSKTVGICGSGILSSVKELLRVGLVRKNGSFIKLDKLDEDDYRHGMMRLNGTKREFTLGGRYNDIIITQGDIRQVQLAKGAILSGFYALIKQAGLTEHDIDRVIIAGQFGSHISVDSLVGVGLLPRSTTDKLSYVGNSSKTGAYMALMSEKVKRNMECLSREIDYMELGASEGYERLFSECLIFEGYK